MNAGEFKDGNMQPLQYGSYKLLDEITASQAL